MFFVEETKLQRALNVFVEETIFQYFFTNENRLFQTHFQTLTAYQPATTIQRPIIVVNGGLWSPFKLLATAHWS